MTKDATMFIEEIEGQFIKDCENAVVGVIQTAWCDNENRVSRQMQRIIANALGYAWKPFTELKESDIENIKVELKRLTRRAARELGYSKEPELVYE